MHPHYPIPSAANHYLIEHAELLHHSFQHYVGRELAGLPWQGAATAHALFTGNFVLLSHTAEADPIFTYGNQTAMQLFAMDWPQLTQLASRYSAEPLARDERERLLQTVNRQGYIDNYAGVRIASTGQRFTIQQAIVWNLLDKQGRYAGQAAYFDRWTLL
jgi:hypothetical protein